MQKAVSPLSIQITAAILRTVHMYLPNVSYIFVRKFMWGRGPHIFTEQGPIGFKSGPAHVASSSISTSNSDEQYGIPKSKEFPSLVKFDVWFHDSLVHLPGSKSVHWQNQRCHQCPLRARFHNALSYCRCFSIFLTTYSDHKPSNLCQKFFITFLHHNFSICAHFKLKFDRQQSTSYLH